MLPTGLEIGAMTMPLTAINGGAHVVIGHGIPGVVVDICVNDGSGQVEVKSDFRYGKHFKATLPPGTYAFITRLASPGVCKGALVIKATGELIGTEDLSIIATKGTVSRPTRDSMTRPTTSILWPPNCPPWSRSSTRP